MKKQLVCVLVLILFVLSAFTGCIKVVKIGEEGKLTGQTGFDADSVVAKFWSAQAMPELQKDAVDLGTLLSESNGSLKSLGTKYGRYTLGTTGDLSYVVKGTAQVTGVDQTKKAGFLQVALDGYTGQETIELQIGPVYNGTAVRDSLSFLKYQNFENQVQWAEISQSIHKLIQKQVVDPVHADTLSGKTVDFVGCFTVEGNSGLLITPVELSVK